VQSTAKQGVKYPEWRDQPHSVRSIARPDEEPAPAEAPRPAAHAPNHKEHDDHDDHSHGH
jgi:hypothetical protein